GRQASKARLAPPHRGFLRAQSNVRFGSKADIGAYIHNGRKADVRAGRLSNPRPGLRFAAHARKQASAGHDGVLVLDGAGPGKDLVEVGDEDFSLPDFW